MQPRTIAIGDIHGHSAALRALIARVAPQPTDTVVFLGDYVDRGPDSRGVIQQVIELSVRCKTVTLMGNHEQMMLKACHDPDSIQAWLDMGGDSALDSYSTHLDITDVPPAHVQFLDGLLRCCEMEKYFFVHANYAPNQKIAEQDSNTALWRSLEELPRQHYSGKTAVVGHTPQPHGQVLDLDYLLCLDTGCGLGGYLTAMDVESKELWQVDEQGHVCSHGK